MFADPSKKLKTIGIDQETYNTLLAIKKDGRYGNAFTVILRNVTEYIYSQMALDDAAGTILAIRQHNENNFDYLCFNCAKSLHKPDFLLEIIEQKQLQKNGWHYEVLSSIETPVRCYFCNTLLTTPTFVQ